MSRMTLRAGLLATTILLLSAFPALAATRYASPTGAGSPTVCSQAAPCSISDAINDPSVLSGDEVILGPGDYTVAVQLGTSKAIDIHGNGAPELTRIYSSGSPNGLFMNHLNAKFRNFELLHSSGTEAGARIVAGTLEQAIVRSTAGDGCEVDSGLARDAICVTTASSKSGLSMNVGGTGDFSVLLRNVTAIGAGAANSHGIMAYGSDSVNNTLVGKSVIARGQSLDVWAAAANSATMTVSLAYSNYATTGLGGSATRTITDPATNFNQTATPLFVDSGAGNYRQAGGSPTIDAGVLDIFSGTADLDGQVRVFGAAVDIGADEFVVPPSAPVTDTTPPNTRIVKKPKRRSTKRKAKFTFTADEAGATFKCKLDKGVYKTCKSPYSKRVKRGKHTLRMIATDVAGNADPTPAIYRWRVL